MATFSILQSNGAFSAVTLIKDNGGTGTSSTGSWKTSSGANPYGSNSLYASANGASYSYSFNLSQPGEYQVFVRWTDWSNRRTSVPYDIYHANGSSTVRVNQRTNGGQWQRLGNTWTFGSTATITVRSLGSGTTSADAVKLVYAGGNTAGSGISTPPPPADEVAGSTLTRDNGGTGTSLTGSWRRSSGANPYGSSSLYAGSNGATYSYSFNLDQPGEYQVFARWTEWSNRRTSVPYDIYHASGRSTVNVNQRANGGQWQRLGNTWTFANTATVTIRSLGNGTTSADAVRLVYVGSGGTTQPVAPSPAFPIDLRGNTPEERTVTVSASKGAGVSNAIVTLATYDADFPDEGELVINGNSPIRLFGSNGTGGNDQNSASIRLTTPASYWRNGNNTLVFRHLRTQGFVIDAVSVSFESAPVNTNSAPTIGGSPATSVTAGNNYSFRPSASDADGDNLIFSIRNRPSWASFNASTGRLSGTPTSAGTSSNIRISVSDGQDTTSLPAFSITVNSAAPQTGSVSVQWTPPVARADGTALALSEISGYTVRYGTTAGNYPDSVSINGGSSTSAVINNLPLGTCYIVVTSRDVDGRESRQSNMLAKQVQ